MENIKKTIKRIKSLRKGKIWWSSKTVEAKSLKLRCKWTREMAEDLNTFYHQDIEPMLQVASFRDTIQNKIKAFIRKINMKQIIVMLGSAIVSYALLDIFRSSSSILVVNATDAKIQR